MAEGEGQEITEIGAGWLARKFVQVCLWKTLAWLKRRFLAHSEDVQQVFAYLL